MTTHYKKLPVGWLYFVTAFNGRGHRQLCEAVGIMDDFGNLVFV
jgi:hypothetical protein